MLCLVILFNKHNFYYLLVYEYNGIVYLNLKRISDKGYFNISWTMFDLKQLIVDVE